MRQIKFLSDLRELWAFLISPYINYQVTTFGQQYFFRWHTFFKHNINAPSLPLQNTSFLITTLILKPISKGRLAYQASFYIFPSLFASLSNWQNVFFCIAALVLQYVFEPGQPRKTSTKHEDLPDLRLENLPILKYWVVTFLRLSMFLKSLEQSLKTTNQKQEHYDLSLVIVDRLTMIATTFYQ